MSGQPRRILVLDSAPPENLADELDPLLASGAGVTVNLWRLDEREPTLDVYRDRVSFVRFDGFDEDGLITELIRGGRGYNALKTRANIPLSRWVFEAGTRAGLSHRLRVVGQIGAGTNHIDVRAAREHGVLVTHTPGSNAHAVAEHALAVILAAIRGIIGHNAASHRGQWRGHPVSFPPELSELTLGIVGPGLIGQALACKAGALGMRVVALGSARFDTGRAALLGLPRAASLAELLAVSDVVSLHCPLTDETRGLIGAGELSAMKPGSLLVDMARGGVVDEAALAAALQDPSSPPAAAAVDVFTKEHAEFDSPLVGVANVILTPHIAGMTRAAARRATDQLSRNIVALLDGRQDGVALAGHDRFPGTEIRQEV